MRRAYLALGACGGVVGLGVHLDLLINSLQPAGQNAGGWSSAAIGIALSVAAVGATAVARVYRQPGAIFLFALAILGLFANPLSWIPAAVLLMAAASLVSIDRRESGEHTAHKPHAAPVIRMASGGGRPHWSMASQDDAPSEHGLHPPAALPATSRRAPWGARSRTMAVALVVVVAAVVIPLSLWPQESVAATSASVGQSAEIEVVQQRPPVTLSIKDILAGKSAETEVTAPSSTTSSSTTSTTTLTRIGQDDPDDPGSSVWYSDIRFGLTLAVPVDWAEVPASTLADYDPTAYHLACFADADGPTHKDAYLNGIDIRVVAGSQTEDPPDDLARLTLEKALSDGPQAYDYFQVVRSVHETQIADTDALAATVRITWNKRVMVKKLITCVTNHCLYLIVLQTDDADWDTYRPVFDEILASFAFAPGVTD